MKLEDVLKKSKDVFISWRYVFEVNNTKIEHSHRLHTFEYLLMLLACVAVNAVILRNWYTPRLGTDPNAPRASLVLSDSDFAKVSLDDWVSATVTDQYTGKRYNIRKIGGDHIAEDLS